MRVNRYYYIGFNANNAILNESFFSGSITLNPNGEKGNIFYSYESISDTSSEEFIKDYKNFIINTMEKLKDNKYRNYYICFNKKIKEICLDIKNANVIFDKNDSAVEILNNKFSSRQFVSDIIPVLDYSFAKDGKSYSDLSKKYNTRKLVYQLSHGAGGFETFLVDSKIKAYKLKPGDYCISEYIKNTPLNITAMISDRDILLFPISAQLIKLTNGCFKYVGADFEYINRMNKDIIKQIIKKSKKICERVQGIGYRGILGIDYLYVSDKIYFMEFNPRFQSSSFLINIELERNGIPCLAKLHYESITHSPLSTSQRYLNGLSIHKSFLNSSSDQNILCIKEDERILNGYYEKNKKSVYRKVYNKSIINLNSFEFEKKRND